MNVTTEIKPENPKLLRILVDGHPYRSADRVLFKRYFLKPTPFSTHQEFSHWFTELERRVAKHYALKLLSLQSSYAAKLHEKLKKKSFSEETIQFILSEVKRLGYINDDHFWERVVEKEIRKGWGPRYIFQKLQSKKVDREKISELLQELYPIREQEKQIEKLLLKKRGTKEQRAAFLQRRGFSTDTIMKKVF